MGTTSEFIKLRSTGTPKTGEWNINYSEALAKAKNEHKYIITCWSNGDICSHCVASEKCMMTDIFKNWMKESNAYFVFQCSDDKDKGQMLHDWIFTGTHVNLYPGFRITLYDSAGKILCDRAIDGDKLRNKKVNAYGAKEMIANLEAIMAIVPAKDLCEENTVQENEDYKIRLNEKLTTAKINKILDAIDNNDGYCPCQPRSEGTKCHCEDFIYSKKTGEPCICKIYVKQSKSSNKKSSKKNSKKNANSSSKIKIKK